MPKTWLQKGENSTWSDMRERKISFSPFSVWYFLYVHSGFFYYMFTEIKSMSFFFFFSYIFCSYYIPCVLLWKWFHIIIVKYIMCEWVFPKVEKWSNTVQIFDKCCWNKFRKALFSWALTMILVLFYYIIDTWWIIDRTTKSSLYSIYIL